MISIYLAFVHALFMLSTSHEWRTAFKWSANGFMAFSAITVSFSVAYAQYSPVFVGFLIGHLLWMMSAMSVKDTALVTLNAGFIPIDIYAMYIRL